MKKNYDLPIDRDNGGGIKDTTRLSGNSAGETTRLCCSVLFVFVNSGSHCTPAVSRLEPLLAVYNNVLRLAEPRVTYHG